MCLDANIIALILIVYVVFPLILIAGIIFVITQIISKNDKLK